MKQELNVNKCLGCVAEYTRYLLTIDAHGACGNCFTNQVLSFAHVSSRILRVRIQNIQSYESEVVGCLESMTYKYNAYRSHLVIVLGVRNCVDDSSHFPP